MPISPAFATEEPKTKPICVTLKEVEITQLYENIEAGGPQNDPAAPDFFEQAKHAVEIQGEKITLSPPLIAEFATPFGEYRQTVLTRTELIFNQDPKVYEENIQLVAEGITKIEDFRVHLHRSYFQASLSNAVVLGGGGTIAGAVIGAPVGLVKGSIAAVATKASGFAFVKGMVAATLKGAAIGTVRGIYFGGVYGALIGAGTGLAYTARQLYLANKANVAGIATLQFIIKCHDLLDDIKEYEAEKPFANRLELKSRNQFSLPKDGIFAEDLEKRGSHGDSHDLPRATSTATDLPQPRALFERILEHDERQKSEADEHYGSDTKNKQAYESDESDDEREDLVRRIFFSHAQGKSEHYIAAENIANKIVSLIDKAEALKNKSFQLVGRDLCLFLRNGAEENKFRRLVSEVLDRKLENRDLQNRV